MTTARYSLPPPLATRGALEEDNERLTGELEQKVAALNAATRSIHDELREHNRMLDGMVSRFAGASLGDDVAHPSPLFPAGGRL